MNNESLQRFVLPNNPIDPSIVRVLRTLDPIAREADCPYFVAGATETVIGWHRAGFRLYWRWRSRPGGGRPKITPEMRALIRRLAKDNPESVSR